MLAVKLLLVLPAFNALAMPVIERIDTVEAGNIKRDAAQEVATPVPEFRRPNTVKRTAAEEVATRVPASWRPDEKRDAAQEVATPVPAFWRPDEKRDAAQEVATPIPALWRPDTVKPDEEVATRVPAFWRPDIKRDDTSDVVPEFWIPDIKRDDKFEGVPEFWRPDMKRGSKWTQPDLPEYIDTCACICGLLSSQSTLPYTGYGAEMWRCIGDETFDISSGGNGKWYNTSLPSQELSGINEPRNWGLNPPNASVAYILVFKDGGAFYEIADSENASALFGNDTLCTGVNDTSASTTWYATQ